MDEKGVSCSFALISEDKIDTLYPMFFSVSCAYFALKLLPEPSCDDDDKWLELRNRMLRGSAHLLGLLIWRVQRGEVNSRKSGLVSKLENAERQIEELKKRRSEEAKANEKVVTIFAAREQTWCEERRRLRHQIGALMNDLRAFKKNKENSIAELSRKLELKDKSIEDVEKKRVEIEEKVKKAENLVEELSQRHCSEILKHKTAFIELVSNQRQLEAEVARAVRHVEVAKQEVDAVLDQKEQAVLMTQRLSMELVKIGKNLEQKDQILSALLRICKLDTSEKQILLREVKSSNAQSQQNELEMATWNAASEPKQDRYSLRNMLPKAMMSVDAGNRKAVKTDHFHEFEQPEAFPVLPDSYMNTGADKPQSIGDVECLENWEIAMQQRHNLEMDAFVEQLRIKDEKMEAFRWRLLSMEIESKRLHSHIERLDHDITHLRKENIRLEGLLLDRETELHSLKEQLVMQFNPPNLQKLNFTSSINEVSINHNTVWSKVKRKPGQKRQETKEICQTDEIPPGDLRKDIVLSLQYPHADHMRQESVETLPSVGEGSSKRNPTMKLDIHALGVSYKIKRLKQQFLLLERLTGKQESCENDENINGNFAVKGLPTLISLLNKQADRYQSLQAKTDDLCQRMDENDLNLNCRGSAIAKTNDETRRLEKFLEETFQLQRYTVATGQRLIEVQAKIASGFVEVEEKIEKPESFDIKRFADSIRMLFREVQRGLEVRISRIIGDLEGSLACDGIMHFKK